MNVTARTPLGVEVTGVSLPDLADEHINRVRHLLAEHGVLVLRDQMVDDDAFVDFLARFGPLMFTAGETPVAGYPDLNVISNVGRGIPPRSVFHVDTSYVARPPAYTALRAVEIPERGGDTLFTNQYRAFATLDPAVRARLDDATIRHSVTGPVLGDDDEQSAEHPALRRHPVSGRTALYLSTPERCVAVSSLDDVEGRQLIAQLYAHSTATDNIYRHSWRPGDVVMWDNRCVLHRADHADVIGDRVMHRGMVADTSSEAA